MPIGESFFKSVNEPSSPIDLNLSLELSENDLGGEEGADSEKSEIQNILQNFNFEESSPQKQAGSDHEHMHEPSKNDTIEFQK